MDFDNDTLWYEEKAILNMRNMYYKAGYVPFKVSRFEEYEFYAAHKSFLPGGDIVTFTDTNGKLMALRPDVTLSIVKSLSDGDGLKKLCYNENVYRTVDGQLKEQMQVGLECIGQINVEQVAEVLMLAAYSLDVFERPARLDISHMGFLSGLLGSEDISDKQKVRITKCISDKNISELKTICKDTGFSDRLYDKLTTLIGLCSDIGGAVATLKQISVNTQTEDAINELIKLDDELKKLNIGDNTSICVDFSVASDINYYSGIIFRGFVEGVPSMVLSGGRYDRLLQSFGRNDGAVGFAVYISTAAASPALRAEGLNTSCSNSEDKLLSIALPKGRLGETAYALLEKAGYGCSDIEKDSRKLVFEDNKRAIRYFWVKPSDVAVYVERGAADIGIIGKDTLLEDNADVYELLDLGIGKCRMCVAAKNGYKYEQCKSKSEKTLRVASKFPNIAREHFTKHGRDIDVIKLHGSVELAPLIDLSDVIVDLVETGRTLSDNDMSVIETITDISARLIANKTSYKFKQEKFNDICNALTR